MMFAVFTTIPLKVMGFLTIMTDKMENKIFEKYEL